MRRPPIRGSLSLAALLLACVTIARADATMVRHEYVPDVASDEGSLVVSSGGLEPEALVYDGEVIPAPEGGALRENERAMQAIPGDERTTEEAGRRSPSFRPDRITELNAQVGYYAVFTPTITPFKRVTALDGVTLAAGGVPVLAIADRGPRARIEPVGTQSAAPDGRPRDLFWGSVVIDFSAGREAPFPSVSPESRILTVRTEPATQLHFERDGADNFFVVLDEPGRSSASVRVVFLTDAPRTYFGTELPTGPANALEHEVPQVPASMQRRAEQFAATLGLQRGEPFDRTLSRLVDWFRGFEESHEPPRDTGDIYWDLATGQRGVCRHRAYGFVITAQALGIHARFVQNEAHAWVEVHLPERRGWMRIDLGGSPRGLTARNTEDRPSYRVTAPDPLPRPEPYRRAYEEAARLSQAETSGGGAEQGGASATAADTAGGGAGEQGGGAGEPGGGAGRPPRVEVDEGGAPREHRAPLTLRLDVNRTVPVLRGQSIEITGTARTGDAGVAGLRIEVLLSSERAAHERMLGVTVTSEHGGFHASFGVPPDLAVGDYRLIVRSPGNAQVGPGMAL